MFQDFQHPHGSRALIGKCPTSPALQAGSLPTGRQEGEQYKRLSHYREAPPFGRGASKVVQHDA